MGNGILYLVGTPIGNLEDITLRALKILNHVDMIACEDTTKSIKLLNRYNIKKPLISYYKPKEKEKLTKILELLQEGKNIALISDAGMPLISDPGEMLVRAAREKQIKLESIPGPSSTLVALSLSGFSTERFIFEGFLPKKLTETKKILQELKDLPHTIIFFVPARNIYDALTAIYDIIGNRMVCIARELTKHFEEVIVDSVENLLKDKRTFKGEITLVIEGAKEKKQEIDEDEIVKMLKNEQDKDKTFKDILKENKFKELPKNLLYDLWEETKRWKKKK